MKKMFSTLWYHFIRISAKIAANLYFRIKFEGLENIPESGQFLLLCNHQSFLDPVLSSTPHRRVLCFMARDTLFRNFFFGGLIRSVNAIPVRRGEADITAMKSIIAKLQEGYGICLYPEGTRTLDGKIAAVKPGFGLLTRRGKAGIVPMVIDGMFELWPKTRKYPRPGKIYVKFGEYIPLEEIKKMGEEDFAALLTSRMRTMQNELRTMQGKAVLNYDTDNDADSIVSNTVSNGCSDNGRAGDLQADQ